MSNLFEREYDPEVAQILDHANVQVHNDNLASNVVDSVYAYLNAPYSYFLYRHEYGSTVNSLLKQRRTVKHFGRS